MRNFFNGLLTWLLNLVGLTRQSDYIEALSTALKHHQTANRLHRIICEAHRFALQVESEGCECTAGPLRHNLKWQALMSRLGSTFLNDMSAVPAALPLTTLTFDELRKKNVATLYDASRCLRQLQAENKALKEDKRRLDWLEHSQSDVEVWQKLDDTPLFNVNNLRTSSGDKPSLREAIDAALQQERNDEQSRR